MHISHSLKSTIAALNVIRKNKSLRYPQNKSERNVGPSHSETIEKKLLSREILPVSVLEESPFRGDISEHIGFNLILKFRAG